MAIGGAITSSGRVVGAGGKDLGAANKADYRSSGGGSSSRTTTDTSPTVNINQSQLDALAKLGGGSTTDLKQYTRTTPSVISSQEANDRVNQSLTTIGGAQALSAYDANGLYNTKRAKQAKAGLDTQLAYIDSIMDQSDATAKQQLQGIRDQYAQIQASQEQANKQYEGGVTTAGLVSGRARYAPEIQAGMQAGAVNTGLTALSTIQQKKNQVLAEAQQAQTDRNYKLMTQKTDIYNNLIKDERETASQISKDYYTARADKRAEIESVYSNQIPGAASTLRGMTDPAQIDSYIKNVSNATGLSEQEVAQGVQSYYAKQAADSSKSLLSLAAEYPDAYITSADIQNGNIDSVMMKVANSSSYKMANALKQSQINKNLATLAHGGADDSALAFYAEQLATTGKLDTKTPKEAVGIVSEMAKMVPINDGTIIDKTKGYASNAFSGPQTDAITASVGILELTKRFKEVASSGEVWTGPLDAIGQSVDVLKGGETFQRQLYNDYRSQILGLLGKARSGLAMSDKEYERISKLLPSKWTFNRLQDSGIDNFEDALKTSVKTVLDSQNGAVKGVYFTLSTDVKKASEFDN